MSQKTARVLTITLAVTAILLCWWLYGNLHGLEREAKATQSTLSTPGSVEHLDHALLERPSEQGSSSGLDGESVDRRDLLVQATVLDKRTGQPIPELRIHSTVGGAEDETDADGGFALQNSKVQGTSIRIEDLDVLVDEVSLPTEPWPATHAIDVLIGPTYPIRLDPPPAGPIKGEARLLETVLPINSCGEILVHDHYLEVARLPRDYGDTIREWPWTPIRGGQRPWVRFPRPRSSVPDEDVGVGIAWKSSL